MKKGFGRHVKHCNVMHGPGGLRRPAGGLGCKRRRPGYIQENGTLKIGITLFQPMNYYDENEPDKLVGFDTELAEAVCEKLGVTPEFIEIDWDQKVIELQSKISIASGTA